MAHKFTTPADTRFTQSIMEAAANGALPHAIILSGQGDLIAAARFAAAAMQCMQMPHPCGTCTACRKIERGIHPDVITVEDKEHKKVPVKLVRQVRDDMFVRPNEGARKIYILHQELGIEGQNALLKTLEEPPKYGVFILLTDNPEKL